MKLNPKQLAASAALLGVLACAAALPASAAGPVTTPLALTLPKVSFPWDKVTAESIETGSYDAAPLAVAPIPRTGNYSIAVCECDSAEGPYTFGTYLWAKFKNLSAWERKLIEGPYIHHMAEIEGDYTEELREFTKYVKNVTLDTVQE